MSVEQCGAEGSAFLKELLTRMGLEVQVAPGPEHDGAAVLQLTGNTEPLRRSADLLGALSLVTAQVASRRLGERCRCVLDLDGDFAERCALLEVVAEDVARSVVNSGRRAVIDGLNSAERRVVHTALVDDDEVQTRSEGAGDHRFLLVERAGDEG